MEQNTGHLAEKILQHRWEELDDVLSILQYFFFEIKANNQHLVLGLADGAYSHKGLKAHYCVVFLIDFFSNQVKS